MIRIILALALMVLGASTASAQYPVYGPNPYYHPNGYYWQAVQQQRNLTVLQAQQRQMIANQRAVQNAAAQQRGAAYQAYLKQQRILILGRP